MLAVVCVCVGMSRCRLFQPSPLMVYESGLEFVHQLAGLGPGAASSQGSTSSSPKKTSGRAFSKIIAFTNPGASTWLYQDDKLHKAGVYVLDDTAGASAAASLCFWNAIPHRQRMMQDLANVMASGK